MGAVIIDDWTSDADVKAALLKGAALLAWGYHLHGHTTLTAYAPPTRISAWWTLDHTLVVPPVAFPAISANKAVIDGFTLESDSTCFFGGFLLGDFTSMHVPVVDTASVSSALTDMLGSSLMSAISGEYQLAYALQQAAFALMSMAERRVVERPSSTADVFEVTPYGL